VVKAKFNLIDNPVLFVFPPELKFIMYSIPYPICEICRNLSTEQTFFKELPISGIFLLIRSLCIPKNGVQHWMFGVPTKQWYCLVVVVHYSGRFFSLLFWVHILSPSRGTSRAFCRFLLGFVGQNKSPKETKNLWGGCNVLRNAFFTLFLYTKHNNIIRQLCAHFSSVWYYRKLGGYL